MPILPALPLPTFDALHLGAHRLFALTDEGLFDACSVRIAFTGRAGGVSEGPFASLNCKQGIGDDPAAVGRNRELICEAIGADPARLVVPDQVHGTRVIVVGDASGDVAAPVDGASPMRSGDYEAGEPSECVEADAVVATAPGVPVLMNFADCLSLVIVSPTGRFAVVHAGWRGAVAHIAHKAARVLARCDEAPASAYNAYIGPHIRSECFEVGDDVEGRFRDEFGDVAVPAACHVDLAAAVACDLQRAGLEARRIADCGICTKCESDWYFSYRASGGACGRHTACAVKLA